MATQMIRIKSQPEILFAAAILDITFGVSGSQPVIQIGRRQGCHYSSSCTPSERETTGADVRVGFELPNNSARAPQNFGRDR